MGWRNAVDGEDVSAAEDAGWGKRAVAAATRDMIERRIMIAEIRYGSTAGARAQTCEQEKMSLAFHGEGGGK